MKDASDPKALIFESYRIEGISYGECRSIFMDWALSLPDPDPAPHIAALLDRYGGDSPDHPMTAVLREAQEAPPKAARRGGRSGRVGRD
ncbi:MAG: hypothetical protein COW55_00855 [Rhodobacteraceae bacterium CG17_big_fil_post_rev_8_21_14_2_50_65_11]|nr:MAG: hypothetical protein COW55_00855 [Rhodobacteraceae bacterium CG17_big_fil_post_rev_8_21_14_2_50_65_11]